MPNYPMPYPQMSAPYAPPYGAAAWQPQQFQQSYAPQQQQQFMPPQPSRQPQSCLNWCQGIEGAKGFYVAPGTSELIMDSEGPIFYIKAVDSSGVPSPLRIFRYSEEMSAQATAPSRNQDYITRQELPALFAQLMAQQNGGNENA